MATLRECSPYGRVKACWKENKVEIFGGLGERRLQWQFLGTSSVSSLEELDFCDRK